MFESPDLPIHIYGSYISVHVILVVNLLHFSYFDFLCCSENNP